MKNVKALFYLFFLLCLFSMIANAETSGTYDSLTYQILNEEVTITGGDTTAETVIIPAEIEGYPVTSIVANAFYNFKSLTSITIPASVTSIGSATFVGCTSLIEINVDEKSESYLSDEYGVLYSKDKTKLICCPPKVETITSYIIPNSVTSIMVSAFYDCTTLTSITIPASVTSIGTTTFSGCTSLEDITIPASVTSIGAYAFSDCTSLASITIPNSVTSIGAYAFGDCTSLASITIPDSVTSIGDKAFYYCISLEDITILASVTSIGTSAFSNCKSLTSITIPASVTSIGKNAFWLCTSLTSITIPARVTSIGSLAFGGCTSLTIYGYTNSTADTYAQANTIPFVAIDDALVYTGTSLILDGSLGVKMFFKYDEDLIDGSSATLNVTLKNSIDNSEITEELPLTLDTDGKSLYAVVYLPPKDIDNITISSTVTAKIFGGSEISVSDIPDVTVPAYIESVKDLAETDEACAKALKLVNALEVYSDYAHKYFDDTVTNFEEISLDESEVSKIKALASPAILPDKKFGNLEFYSTSLILEGKVTLRHYFKVTGEIKLDDYAVEGASALKVIEGNNSYVYVDIENISADKLSEQKTVTIKYSGDETTITFSPLNYVGLTYEHKDAKLRNLAKALYRYSVEADRYINGTPVEPEENETEAKEW